MIVSYTYQVLVYVDSSLFLLWSYHTFQFYFDPFRHYYCVLSCILLPTASILLMWCPLVLFTLRVLYKLKNRAPFRLSGPVLTRIPDSTLRKEQAIIPPVVSSLFFAFFADSRQHFKQANCVHVPHTARGPAFMTLKPGTAINSCDTHYSSADH